MRKNSLSKTLAILALAAMLGLTACGPAGVLVAANPVVAPTAVSRSDAVTLAPTATPISVALTLPQSVELVTQEQLLEDLYQRVNPSVVNITTVQATAQGSGSGFVYDDQGHIVTNNHVVEGASKIWVTFADGTMVSATVVGTDPGSDLAVIKVSGPASELRPVTFGDSDALRVGQFAAAIGNPFGLEGTMTTGIISAVGRVMPSSNSGFAIVDLVQTDVAINPGNSGSPLLDSAGRVVGVNTLIFSETGVAAGVGLSVPAATVIRVVPSLIADGHYAHPWLGVSGGSITPALAESLNLPVQQGVLVQTVTAGGPADRAGIRGGTQRVQANGRSVATDGDIIVAVDDVEVKSFDDLVSYLGRNVKVGQRVMLTVLRDGQRQSIEAVLGERPAAV